MTTSSECRGKSDYVWRSCLGAESWYLAAGYQKSEPSYSLGSWQRISCDSSKTGKMITAGELGTAGGGGWKRRVGLKWPCLTNRAESELVSSMLVIVKMCRAANTNGRSVRLTRTYLTNFSASLPAVLKQIHLHGDVNFKWLWQLIKMQHGRGLTYETEAQTRGCLDSKVGFTDLCEQRRSVFKKKKLISNTIHVYWSLVCK